ncbi:DUF4913 domain-containing protein [Arthrobacter sp. CAN_A1]|uniref:DUF4913 domain-containing protein n=1 Tax=Arthrobacter sp. CAN_A1 TaxID=2787717 RepID=UPI0018C8D799
MSEFSSEFDNGFSAGSEATEEQPATADEPAELVYSNPLEFFVSILSPSYVREVNGGSEFVWCPQWYKHVEALSRVETVWRSWEHLRLEGALGLSTWWLNHADPHMRVLMAPNGPFKKCIYDGHAPRDRAELLRLPHTDPEEALFR